MNLRQLLPMVSDRERKYEDAVYVQDDVQVPDTPAAHGDISIGDTVTLDYTLDDVEVTVKSIHTGYCGFRSPYVRVVATAQTQGLDVPVGAELRINTITGRAVAFDSPLATGGYPQVGKGASLHA